MGMLSGNNNKVRADRSGLVGLCFFFCGKGLTRIGGGYGIIIANNINIQNYERAEDTVMDVLDLRWLQQLYEMKDKTVEEKVKETVLKFPQLSSLYEDDLMTLFTEPLPLIEGLEIDTQFNDSACSYVMIMKMPDSILPEVQKALMRIGGCLGGFTVEQWGTGSLKTETMKRRMQEYADQYAREHNRILKYIPGEKAGYPKVFPIWPEEVDGADNETWKIYKVSGLVLS